MNRPIVYGWDCDCVSVSNRYLTRFVVAHQDDTLLFRFLIFSYARSLSMKGEAPVNVKHASISSALPGTEHAKNMQEQNENSFRRGSCYAPAGADRHFWLPL